MKRGLGSGLGSLLGARRTHELGGLIPEKKKRTYAESDVQKKVVAWLRDKPAWMVLSLENGAKRTPMQTARLKALGMREGAPDLLLLYRSQLVWLELKSLTGKLSDAQKQCHAELRARGQIVLVGYGYEGTIAQLRAVEIPPIFGVDFGPDKEICAVCKE